MFFNYRCSIIYITLQLNALLSKFYQSPEAVLEDVHNLFEQPTSHSSFNFFIRRIGFCPQIFFHFREEMDIDGAKSGLYGGCMSTFSPVKHTACCHRMFSSLLVMQVKCSCWSVTVPYTNRNLRANASRWNYEIILPLNSLIQIVLKLIIEWVVIQGGSDKFRKEIEACISQCWSFFIAKQPVCCGVWQPWSLDLIHSL